MLHHCFQADMHTACQGKGLSLLSLAFIQHKSSCMQALAIALSLLGNRSLLRFRRHSMLSQQGRSPCVA